MAATGAVLLVAAGLVACEGGPNRMNSVQIAPGVILQQSKTHTFLSADTCSGETMVMSSEGTDEFTVELLSAIGREYAKDLQNCEDVDEQDAEVGA